MKNNHHFQKACQVRLSDLGLFLCPLRKGTTQDGSVCNLQLMPIKLLSSVVQFAKNWLLPYGLSIVSGEVIEEVDGTVVDDVARFISENFAEGFIAKNFFETNSIENSAYYDITTGRLVVTEAIWVHGFTDTAGEDRSIRW